MSRNGETQPCALLLTYGPVDRQTGGSLYNATVVRGLTERGLPVTVHPLSQDQYFFAPLRGLTGELHRILNATPWSLILVDELVHPTLLLLLSRVTAPIVPIVHLLRINDRVGPVGRLIACRRERRLLETAAMIVVNSHATERSVRDLCRRSPPIVVCPPGTKPVDRDNTAWAGLPAIPSILCVANFFPVKGQDLLLKALSQVRDIPWKLRLIGDMTVDPTFARRVQRLVRTTGLKDRVELTGPAYGTSLARAYRAADLFVLPSRYEAYGMALAEAVSFGLPFVAFDVGGVREVADGSGLLVPPGDPRKLAKTIRRILTDGETFREARRSSQSRRETLPTWDETLDRLHTSLAPFLDP